VTFYALFAVTITASVQLVGVYLVFTTLIVPALATRRMAMSYVLGAFGYALGLALSLVSDLPPGPLIVCTMTALGIVTALLTSRQAPA